MDIYTNLEEYNPPKDKIEEIQNQLLSELDDKFLYFLLGMFGSGILLSFLNESWFLALTSSGMVFSVYIGAHLLMTNRKLVRYLLVLVLFVFQIQLLFQFQGAEYMHFFYFIVTTALIFYQDWRYVSIYYGLSQLLFILSPFFFTHDEDIYDQLLNTNYSLLAVIINGELAIELLLNLLHFIVCLILTKQIKDSTLEKNKRDLYLKDQIRVEANTQLVKEIAEGNYNSEYQLAEHDLIGRMLLNLRESLKHLKERDEMQKWVATGLASINDLLIATGDFEKLSHKVLRELIIYLQAYQGAIYIVHQDDIGKKTLRLVSAYAYNKRQKIDAIYEIGEGLVGEVALKKKTIFLEQIPEGYTSIASGLGESIPKSIVIVPLKLKEDVMGVLEIASFNIIKKYEVDFLEQVSENIAATILSTQSTSNTARLLEEARSANEQLKAQEEEMRQNLEELVATQEEMIRKQSEIEKIEEKNRALERDLKLKEVRISEWQNRFVQMTKKIETMEAEIRLREDKVEANQALAQSLINGSPHSIIIFNEEGKIKSFNLPAVKSFALKGEKVNEITIEDLLGDDYKEALLLPKKKYVKKLTGETFHAKFNITVYTNEEGFRTYIAHILDIAKRPESEDYTPSLIRKKETTSSTSEDLEVDKTFQNKKILEIASDTEGCFYCYNLSHDNKLELLGDNVLIITGYPKNRFLDEDGIHIQDLIPDGYKHIQRKLFEIKETNQITKVRYPLQREDGITIWIEDISIVEQTEDGEKIRLGMIWQSNLD
ncbi:MAG: hypothetical protein OHK0038_12480 [Flammeovirgaceae bacterium]